jgi:hypothetical protein
MIEKDETNRKKRKGKAIENEKKKCEERRIRKIEGRQRGEIGFRESGKRTK